MLRPLEVVHVAFQGSLQELPLPDIIQLVAVSGKSGVFNLERDQRVGQIYLREGQIVHAASGDRLVGEEAMYELATWSEGEFRFEAGVEAPELSISKTNTNLLMEAARRIDEWNVLSKRIPTVQHIPVFREEDVTTSVSFAPNEWSIICKVDGRRSIEEISLSLGQSPFEVSKALYGLITSGLLGLREDVLSPFETALAGLDGSAADEVAQRLVAMAREICSPPTAESDQRMERAFVSYSRRRQAGQVVAAFDELLQALEQSLLIVRGPEAVPALDRKARDLFQALAVPS